MKRIIILSILGLFSFSCSNGSSSQTKPVSSPSSSTGIANPASQFCVEQGGNLSIKKDASGNETGICSFNDKSECEEWSFFNGNCKKGQTKS